MKHRHEHPEQQDQHEAPQEVRDRQRYGGGHVERPLGGRISQARAQERRRQPERHRDGEGHERQLQRRRQPAKDEAEDRLAGGDGGSEVAAQHDLKVTQLYTHALHGMVVNADDRKLASLEEYVLIDLDTRTTDCSREGADGLWVLHPFARDESVELASVALTLSAAQLFADVVEP